MIVAVFLIHSIPPREQVNQTCLWYTSSLFPPNPLTYQHIGHRQRCDKVVARLPDVPIYYERQQHQDVPRDRQYDAHPQADGYEDGLPEDERRQHRPDDGALVPRGVAGEGGVRGGGEGQGAVAQEAERVGRSQVGCRVEEGLGALG